ncbi:MAG: hypothetical protein ABH805_01500 [Candidatus Nealsonbacteria bacterium]
MRSDKNLAIKLRKQKKSYNKISKALSVPKSTIHYWFRKASFSKKIKEELIKKAKILARKNLIIYARIRSEKAAKIREGFIEKSSKDITKLSKKDLRLIGTALYWAEGNTKNKNRLQFSNSNPLMIEVAIRFFREICDISDDKIGARVHIYPGINYPKVLNFWSQVTKLPKHNFYPPQIQVSKASKGRRLKNTLPYGTLHLNINNTELACKVKGWIRGIVKNI